MNPNINIRQALTQGALWTAIAQYSGALIQLVVTVILARLLDPTDFGVLAMVVTYTGFVGIFAEGGISMTVIQKHKLNDRDLSSVFWFSGIFALMLVLATIVIAPFIEDFFKFSGLSFVIEVMSINLFLAGLSSVPNGKLRRTLKFKQLAIMRISISTFSGIIAIFLATQGAGYWAIVFQSILGTSLGLIASLVYSGWLPRLVFDVSVIREVLSFSVYIVGFSGINYWARNADNLLIGKFLGASQLGFYSQAYRLMTLPQSFLTDVIGSVLHPVFSNVQNEVNKIRSAYLKVLKLIIYISLSLSAYMYVMAPQIISTILGNGWEESIPVFKYLSLVAALQPATATTGSILVARNRADLFFKMGIASTIVYVVGFILSVHYGIVMVAQTYLITNLIVCPIVLSLTYRLVLEGDPLEILKNTKAAVISAIIVLVLCLIVTYLMRDFSNFSQLIVSSILIMAINSYLFFHKKGVFA